MQIHGNTCSVEGTPTAAQWQFLDHLTANITQHKTSGCLQNVVETTENGWRNLILHRIKAVFGYGL